MVTTHLGNVCFTERMGGGGGGGGKKFTLEKGGGGEGGGAGGGGGGGINVTTVTLVCRELEKSKDIILRTNPKLTNKNILNILKALVFFYVNDLG